MDKPLPVSQIRSLTESFVLDMDEDARKIRLSGPGLGGSKIDRSLVESLLFSVYKAGYERMFETAPLHIVPKAAPDA